MYKLKKFVLVFEPEKQNYTKYTLPLQNAGFEVVFSKTNEDFIAKAIELAPEVCIFNETHKAVDTQKILKILRTDTLLETISYIMLVDKIGHNASTKAKELKVELEIFPINNHHLLQAVKKLSGNFTLPEMTYDQGVDVVVSSHIEIFSFSQLGFSFAIPIKMTKGSRVTVKAQLFEKLGIFQEEFTVLSTAQNPKKSGYICYTSFKGLSTETLKRIKNYKNGTGV